MRLQLVRAVIASIVLIVPSVHAADAEPAKTKVAAIHFAPKLGDVAGNRDRLVALTREAARNGAKIVVNTEMATSGYSFFSRAEIAKVAETVPGPTTNALGAVASEFQAYVVVGLPTVDLATSRYFNAAVLIGPSGTVVGVYRKRSMLLESAYNAEAFEPIPVHNTPYGKVAIAICADLFYSQIPRLAAVAGAQILLAPANVGIETDFLKVRAIENNLAIIVANRYGSEVKGSKPQDFTQNTFALPSPFAYDFSWGARSVIVDAGGTILSAQEVASDSIVYGDLKIEEEHIFPVVRRPDLYGLMAQDTLEPYSRRQMGLPSPGSFAAAAIDPGPGRRDLDGVGAALRSAMESASKQGWTLRLAVLPQALFDSPEAFILDGVHELARTSKVDLVVSFSRSLDGERAPTSILVSAEETGTRAYEYRRTHRLRNEGVATGNDFVVVDRDYGRVAILQAEDMLAPESNAVLAKMGVDVVAVAANSSDPVIAPLLRSRSGEYLHIVSANAQGPEGIYLGGFQASPSEVQGEGQVIMLVDTAHVRDKKEPRFLDVAPLLQACDEHNC